MRLSIGALLLLGGCSLVTSLTDLGGPDASMSADGPAPGTLGGPCYMNNTCNAGLVCELLSGTGVCAAADGAAQVDGAADAGSDGFVMDVIVPPPIDGSCKTPHGPYESDAGVFCPYLADGGETNCGTGRQCCIPAAGLGPSQCISGASLCTWLDASAKNADFRCNETADCQSGQICCLTPPGTVGQDNGCTGYYVAAGVVGTNCQSNCLGAPQVCGQNADCAMGKTCFPLLTEGFWLGVCQ